MARLIILCDGDGVILDWDKASRAVIKNVTGIDIDHESRNEWDILKHPALKGREDACRAAFHEKGFCASLEPIPGAQQGLRALQEIADVYIITSPMPSETWVHERDAAIEKYFGINRKDIGHIHNKWLVRGDVLIDDKTSHIKKWIPWNPAGLGVLWAYNHNLKSNLEHHKNWIRTNCWDTVIEHVLIMAERLKKVQR
jgi:5'(3')-deoxyribonucleotidase